MVFVGRGPPGMPGNLISMARAPTGVVKENGEVNSSGDAGSGVRIRAAAYVFCGCGDSRTSGSDVTVSVSLDWRECDNRRFGVLLDGFKV